MDLGFYPDASSRLRELDGVADEVIKDLLEPDAIRQRLQASPLVSSIESLPTTYLVDRHGRIAKIYEGAVSESEVRADVDSLLAES